MPNSIVIITNSSRAGKTMTSSTMLEPSCFSSSPPAARHRRRRTPDPRKGSAALRAGVAGGVGNLGTPVVDLGDDDAEHDKGRDRHRRDDDDGLHDLAAVAVFSIAQHLDATAVAALQPQ